MPRPLRTNEASAVLGLDSLLLYPQPNAVTACQCTVQSSLCEMGLTQDEPETGRTSTWREEKLDNGNYSCDLIPISSGYMAAVSARFELRISRSSSGRDRLVRCRVLCLTETF